MNLNWSQEKFAKISRHVKRPVFGLTAIQEFQAMQKHCKKWNKKLPKGRKKNIKTIFAIYRDEIYMAYYLVAIMLRMENGYFDHKNEMTILTWCIHSPTEFVCPERRNVRGRTCVGTTQPSVCETGKYFNVWMKFTGHTCQMRSLLWRNDINHIKSDLTSQYKSFCVTISPSQQSYFRRFKCFYVNVEIIG